MKRRRYNYHPYIDDWMRKVEQGKVHACKEHKQLMPLLRTILDDKNVEIRSQEIEDAVELMEKYFFPLYDAELFIVALIVGVFYKNKDQLVFNSVFILAGRGFGKNGLISALAFYFMSDRHDVKHYNVDIVATSEEQAYTSFGDVYEVIYDTPKIQKLFDWNKTQITYKSTRSTLKYRTSNAKTKDGGRPGAVIFDEVHGYADYQDIKVFTGGLGKRKYPRRIYITTDGEIREGVLDYFKNRSQRILNGELEHGGFLPIFFKLDTIQEVGKPDLWDKANPRINHSPELRAQIEIEYDEMLDNEQLKEAFITKRMNIPYAEAGRAAASWEDIVATKELPWPELKNTDCIGCLDYAELKDFAAVGLYFKRDGKRYFKQHTFIHHSALELKRYNIDIDECVREGWATIIYDSPTIPTSMIADWFVNQQKTYNIIKVVGDRFRVAPLTEDFNDRGIPFEAQFFGPITHMKLNPFINKLFTERTLGLEDDKLMRYYINNTGVKSDDKGNKVYFKIEAKRRKTDGFFAFLHGANCDEDLIDSATTYNDEDYSPIIF